jgi:TolB-like protein/cytochrome c-type biogenesis protein CcmH/NrfG
MPESRPSPPVSAIFLSYAREDTEAARRIADALRAFGLEVWFDQVELRGGDAWDQKIRRQIRECALFVPIISATTQARGEGYFRREWNLGVERTRDMAAGVPFILPIVIDETPESQALVPDEFMRYQWTRMARGVPSPQFVSHVTQLLEAPRTPAVERGQSRPPLPSDRAPVGPPASRPALPVWVWGAFGTLALAAAVAVVVLRKPEPAPAKAVAAVPAAPAPVPNDKSIAVLPFENMSEEKDASAFFADGVHEDILTDLSFIRDLRVISRTSVLQYRGTTKSIGQIARELGVAYILEGSVRRAGNRVRVTGQLIRAATDEHVWAKAYDRDITDVFAIQAELAQAIAGALQAAISPTAQTLLEARPTTNSDAYDLYLKARADRNMNGAQDLTQAEKWLVEAVQLDPGFAQAWAQLAALNAFNHFDNEDASEERLAKAKAEIDTAERLAPDDPVVIEMGGDYLYYSHRDFAGAAAHYQRLMVLRPNSPEAVGSLGLIFRRQGHWAEALASFRRALELDPHIGRYRTSLGQLLQSLRRFDEAAAEYRWMVAENPDDLIWKFQLLTVPFFARGSTREMDDWLGHLTPRPKDEATVVAIRRAWARLTGNFAEVLRLNAEHPYDELFSQPHWQQEADAAWDFLSVNNFAEARARTEKLLPEIKAQLAKQPTNSTVWVYLGDAEAVLGDREAALAAAGKLRELLPESADALSGPEQSRNRAGILAWAGEKDEAIAELTRLTRVPFGLDVARVRFDPEWLPLHGDPRYEALLSDPKNREPLF